MSYHKKKTPPLEGCEKELMTIIPNHQTFVIRPNSSTVEISTKFIRISSNTVSEETASSVVTSNSWPSFIFLSPILVKIPAWDLYCNFLPMVCLPKYMFLLSLTWMPQTLILHPQSTQDWGYERHFLMMLLYHPSLRLIFLMILSKASGVNTTWLSPNLIPFIFAK